MERTTAGTFAALLVLLVATAAAPGAAHPQAAAPDDALLDRVRAMARTMPGERPRAVHVLKIVESEGPLSAYVGVPDSQRIPSCYSLFQVRYRDRWIMVDAGLDREMLGANTRARFFPDRYDRLQAALRDAEHVVLTHEHFDHAGGVQRGPYFATVAAKTLLTDEQLRTFLAPPPRGVLRLSPDSAAAFPVLRYDQLFPLAPGVVLIKSPGHTPGAQHVFVQLASGQEILIAGDLAWQMEGVTTGTQRPETASRNLNEDRAAVQPQLDWLSRVAAQGTVAVVLSHDSRSLDALVARGVLASDLDLRTR